MELPYFKCMGTFYRSGEILKPLKQINISMDNSKIKVSCNVKILFLEITYELWYSAGLVLKVDLH